MVDTHLHLDDIAFDGVIDEMVNDFENKNIDFVINNSVDVQSMLKGIELSQKYSRVYTTIGIHPQEVNDFDDNAIALMTKYSTMDKVVAVGEVGLDYHYDPIDVRQKDVFVAQIELADKFKLPLTLHIRDAYKDAEDIFVAEKRHLNNGVLLHCFSGSAEQANVYSKRGFYFSFGGAVTFKKNRKSEVMSAIPITQILTETDAPYMTPEPFRGKVNKPEYISYVLPVMAQVYGVDVKEMERQVKENAKRYFYKIK